MLTGSPLSSGSPTQRGADRSAAGVAVMAVAFAASIVAAAAVVATPRLELVLADDRPWRLAVGVDRLAGVLVVLVSGIGLVVQTYARRALRFDPSAPGFLRWSLALTGASLLVATAASPLVMALAWCAGGVAVVRLVATTRIAAGGGGDALRRPIAVGDAALVLALAVLVAGAGAVDLQAPGEVAAAVGGGWPWYLAAMALVVAVASRSAQQPFHAWLPATVAAPTAVSALLHAGVVNAGAVLVLRLGGMLEPFPGAWLVLAGLAAWTMVTSVSAMAVTPDAKGVLVRSTAAQTGFLLLTTAAGAPVAAVAHLVGHACYKAGAFLGVGGVVSARHRATVIDPPRPGRAAALGLAGLAVAAPALVLGASVAWLPGYDPSLVLVAFALGTAAVALAGWLRHRPDARGVLTGVAATAVLVPAYVALLAALGAYLEPSLAGAATVDGLGWPALALAGVAAAAPAVATRIARHVPTPHLEDAMFRFALGAARPSTPALVPVRVPVRERAVGEVRR